VGETWGGAEESSNVLQLFRRFFIVLTAYFANPGKNESQAGFYRIAAVYEVP